MTFKEDVIAACRAKAKPLGRLLTSMEVVEVACTVHEAHLSNGKAQKRAKPPAEGARAIYDAYPYKMKPEDAIKAITSALEKYPFDYLLGRTKLFSLAVRSWPSAYRFNQADGRDRCPYPASWFRAGSFAEDENLWRVKGARKPAEHQYIPPPEPEGWRDAFPDFTERDKPWNQLQPSQHSFIIAALSAVETSTKLIHEDAEETRFRTA